MTGMGQLHDTIQGDLPSDQTLDRCERCETDTPHSVSIEIRTTKQGDSVGHSRAPFRVAECLECGSEQTTRVGAL